MGFNQEKLLGTLVLALAQYASATTWYVNGVKGSDNNNCFRQRPPARRLIENESETRLRER